MVTDGNGLKEWVFFGKVVWKIRGMKIFGYPEII